ncbi:alpha-E domain-containing protein [Paracoccus sp. p4-l81]|uniref:alpha-E domain-containing protein n=1 Tax=unclassified Paracoccus (in: a-proteobacteria) TaxID=2688777 RepID=UPI0035B942EC
MLLGRTANGMFWMARYIERCEAMARLIDAGQHMELTRGPQVADWRSVMASAGVLGGYLATHPGDGPVQGRDAIDFLLRDVGNPSSVLSCLDAGRSNARMVRTALTRDVWEAVNEAWRRLRTRLAAPVGAAELPALIRDIKQATTLIRGSIQNTQLRTDSFDFAQIGLHLERADTTARILDVKYFVLLPSVSWVGSALDTVQWESILRSVSAHKAYRWAYQADVDPANVADFLILNPRMPRSLAYNYAVVAESLQRLAAQYGTRPPCHETCARIRRQLEVQGIDEIFEQGLHEFLSGFLSGNARLGNEIARDYQFTEVAPCF